MKKTRARRPKDEIDEPVIERSFRRIWPLGIGELKLHWPVVEDIGYTERLYLHAYFVARFVRPKYREQFAKDFTAGRDLRRSMFYRSKDMTSSDLTAEVFPKRLVRARALSVGLLWCHPKYDMSVRLMGRLPEYVVSLTGMQGPVLGVFEPHLGMAFVKGRSGPSFIVWPQGDDGE